MRWQLLSNKTPQNLEELEKIILNNRGIRDKKKFLDVKSPLDLSLKDVGIQNSEYKKAIERIKLAKKNSEKVLIFGDYDADGICATAILWRVLFDFGCKVAPFIPDRSKHGYGINQSVLEEIEKTDGLPDLIITVDNGVVAHGAFEFLAEKSVSAILTDHHQPESDDDGKAIFPHAHAVVHTTDLCGATVSWMLARGISKELSEKELDLCAIATVADQVPLVDANRSFAVFGLEELRRSRRPGLKSLLKQSKIKPETINSQSIGFAIAPRINAMGRLANGIEALRLLCTKNLAKADELSQLLMATNKDRQELTGALMELAVKQAKKQVGLGEKLIIVDSDEFHEGVIGLIAGRLCEQFSRPAIAISVGEKTAKASARSLPGINIVEMVRSVRSDLLEVGGHPMAAGFGLETAKIEKVKERLFKLSRKEISESQLEPVLELDCDLPVDFLTAETHRAIQEFEPFGQGNSRPVFQISNLKVIESLSIGNGAKHLKLILQPVNANNSKMAITPIETLWWRMGGRANEFKKGDLVDVASEIDLNVWNGRSKIQLLAEDVVKK